MRRVAHGIAWFDELTKQQVLGLMKLQSSASRSAYQAIHKHGLRGNEVKKYVKRNYMRSLNQRYVSDAVSRVVAIKDDNALFGGKDAWKDMRSGLIAKEEWQQRRNNQLYSRGDRTKNGNPNIRVVGDELFINSPSEKGRWLTGKLSVPNKWKPCLDCYDVRIIYAKDRFEVKISWAARETTKLPTTAGAIGVDVNPDGVAVVEVSGDGNLQRHCYEREQRIQFARYGKRSYDVKQLAVRAVETAKKSAKVLVMEKLSFGKGKKGGHKFRRMKHNFLYRQILDAMKSRAEREGVPIVEVSPAFTSVLGILKYQQSYSLNRHTAAALVIARRGMGMLERQDFTVTHDDSKKAEWNLEGRNSAIALTQKVYSWLQEGLFLKLKQTALTGPCLAAGSKPAIGHSTGETPVGESLPTTGRECSDNFTLEDERLPSRSEQFSQVV